MFRGSLHSLGVSEFDATEDNYPSYQSAVVRIPRTSPVADIIHRTPKQALIRKSSSDVQEMGFFGVITLVIKIVMLIKTVVDFIKNLIEGSLVKALLALIGFVMPVFGPVFDLGKLGLGFINDIVQQIAGALEGVIGSAVDLVFDTIGIPGIDISKITQLDVFDSVSSASKLMPKELDLRDFIKETAADVAKAQFVPDIPISAEDWASRAVDEKIDSAVKEEISKTPLGKAAVAASDAVDFAEKGSNIAQAIAEGNVSETVSESLDQISEKVENMIPEAPSVPKIPATPSIPNPIPSDIEKKINAEMESLEKKLSESDLLDKASAAAKKELQKQLERVKQLAMDELYKFIMGFLQPGQKFSDLSADQRAMIMDQIRLKWPGWEIPPFNFEMFDSPFWKYRKLLFGAGALGVIGAGVWAFMGGDE